MNLASAVLAVSVTAVLAGCVSVGPNHGTPELPTPVAAEAAAPSLAAEPVRATFWELFGDPVLTDLVTQALAANHDLRIARARLEEARALRRNALFDFLPSVFAGAGQQEVRASSSQLPGVGRADRDYDQYDAGFDATWEIDLFGGLRRNEQAARADRDAADASLDAALVSVTSEVARTYLELRGLQQRYAVASRNADNQRENLKLADARLDAGRGTELDTARARGQLNSTLATLPEIAAAVARAQYRLAVLTGRKPGEPDPRLTTLAALPDVPEIAPVGEPRDWLRGRPDVRAAERNLAAATARVGVAVADLFPRVSFNGSYGFNALTRGELGERDSEAFNFGPSLSWALPDFGHVKSRLDASRARNREALARYEQVVLTSLEDAEGALTTYLRNRERMAALAIAVEANTKATELARMRYEAGVSEFLTVLDAERELLAAETSLVGARTEAATSLVALYKALGAGWQAVPSAAAGR